MVKKQRRAPVAFMVYLGSGREGKKLLENLEKFSGKESLSSTIVALLKKAEPNLFKGVEDGK